MSENARVMQKVRQVCCADCILASGCRRSLRAQIFSGKSRECRILLFFLGKQRLGKKSNFFDLNSLDSHLFDDMKELQQHRNEVETLFLTTKQIICHFSD